MRRSVYVALVAMTVVFPAVAAAQATAPAPNEIAQIQMRLGRIQMQAVQDSAINAEMLAFQMYLQSAMVGLDSASTDKFARANALQAEVEAARTANDNAKLNALAAEATSLQSYFASLQQRAMAIPEVQERREAFTAALVEKMTAIDPQTTELVERLRTLTGSPQ